MKKRLLLLTVATTSIAIGLNLKKATDDYKILPTTITIDHNKYLENMAKKLQESMYYDAHHLTLQFASWADNYVQTFKANRAKVIMNFKNIQDISSIEKIVAKSKIHLRKNEDYEISTKIKAFSAKVKNALLELKAAVINFSHDKDGYKTNSKFNSLVQKYNIIYRDFTELESQIITKTKLSYEQNILWGKLQNQISLELKTEFEKYTNLFLDTISNELQKMENDFKDQSKPINVQPLIDLNDKYSQIKTEMKFIIEQELSTSLAAKINKINILINTLKPLIEKNDKNVLTSWENGLAHTHLTLLTHMKLIETPGEFENIKAMLQEFKKQRKSFNAFKESTKDLNLKFTNAMQSFNDIKKLFTAVRFFGVNKLEQEGLNNHWHSSETTWKSWITSSSFTNQKIPVWEIEAGSSNVAKPTAIVTASNIMPNVTIPGENNLEAEILNATNYTLSNEQHFPQPSATTRFSHEEWLDNIFEYDVNLRATIIKNRLAALWARGETDIVLTKREIIIKAIRQVILERVTPRAIAQAELSGNTIAQETRILFEQETKRLITQGRARTSRLFGSEAVSQAESSAAEGAEMAIVERTGSEAAQETERLLAQGANGSARILGNRAARATTKTIFTTAGIVGTGIGLIIGLGLFTIPETILAGIQTKGAGLTYTFSPGGYATGYLAPTIQIKQSAKPQAMKELNALKELEE